MRVKDFEKAHSQRPFNPFSIHLSDGISYQVPTPEFVAHRPGDRMIVVLELRGPGEAIIDLAHVTRITFDEPALLPETAE